MSQFLTTVNWWQQDKSKADNNPLPQHEADLSKHAFEIVYEMHSDGFVEGELFVTLTREDDSADIEYRGFWKYEEVIDSP